MFWFLFIFGYFIPLILLLITVIYVLIDKDFREQIANPFTYFHLLKISVASIIPILNTVIVYSVIIKHAFNKLESVLNREIM